MIRGESKVTRSQQKLLDKLAWLEEHSLYPAPKETLAAVAGVSPTSGGYFNNLGALRSAGFIEHREIAVGMRGPPRPQRQHALPKVEAELAVDGHRRRNELHLVDQPRAHEAAKGVEVERAAHRQRLRQIGVTDECGAGLRERAIAEQVIGMRMAVNHVADGLRCHRPDGSEEFDTFAHAAAGIDHGDEVLPDDDADVGEPHDCPDVIGDFDGVFSQDRLLLSRSRRCLKQSDHDERERQASHGHDGPPGRQVAVYVSEFTPVRAWSR